MPGDEYFERERIFNALEEVRANMRQSNGEELIRTAEIQKEWFKRLPQGVAPDSPLDTAPPPPTPLSDKDFVEVHPNVYRNHCLKEFKERQIRESEEKHRIWMDGAEQRRKDDEELKAAREAWKAAQVIDEDDEYDFESDEVEARKDDQGKDRWDLMPFLPLMLIAEVITYGAGKYGADNWQKLPNGENRYFAALMRHLTAWRMGESHDEESGLHHLAHAGCCIVFLLWLEGEK